MKGYIIRFDNSSELSAGTLGATTSRFGGCTINGETDAQFYVNEVDMVFDEETDWEFGTANATGGKFDFESVTVHELGHAHQLGHVIDGNAIMHYSIGANTTNRTLSANDIAGGNDVHSRSTTITPCGRFLDGPMTDSNYACSTASIEDQILANGITIFPNPASEKLFITNHTRFNLQKAIIYDVSGRILSNTDLSEFGNTKEIDLKNLSQGIYFLTIISKKASTTKRFVVQ